MKVFENRVLRRHCEIYIIIYIIYVTANGLYLVAVVIMHVHKYEIKITLI